MRNIKQDATDFLLDLFAREVLPMHWLIEVLMPTGVWFELAAVENPMHVGQLLSAITVTGGRPASTVRVTGVDLPLEKKTLAPLPE